MQRKRESNEYINRIMDDEIVKSQKTDHQLDVGVSEDQKKKKEKEEDLYSLGNKILENNFFSL